MPAPRGRTTADRAPPRIRPGPAEAPGRRVARAAADDAAPPSPDPTPAAATTRKRQVAAGPEAAPRPRRRKPPSPIRVDELVAIARASLEDDKAEDIVVLDVADRASFTDRMILATGLVERQIDAMATHLVDALGKAGLTLRRDRIQASPDWVLIDAGDLVIHLFRPEARVTYALERMWGPDSPRGEASLPPETDDAP